METVATELLQNEVIEREVVLRRAVLFLWPSGFIHVREMGDTLDKETSNYLFAINAKLRGKK